MIIKVNPVIDNSVRGLCVKPYPGHPKGCPNYNHKEGCPPSAPPYAEVYDLSKPVYAIINKFDFKDHRARMRQLHPEWSERQIRCCLYWQTGARKQLKGVIKEFFTIHSFKTDEIHYHIETCPEAMGIDVTKTLANAGIILEWPPEIITHQIALAAVERKCRVCGCTWNNACRGGCYWVEKDLCSQCAE